jgi:hypothetical protein
MRALFDDPERARALGRRGRARIAEVGDPERAAAWLTERFAALTGIGLAAA